MRLPAPLVRTWADIQLNFDALVKALSTVTVWSGPSGGQVTASVPAIAMVGGPSITIARAGSYRVAFGAFTQSQAGGLQQGNVTLAKNGANAGFGVAAIGSNAFDGGNIASHGTVTLARGDVLSLLVNTNGINTSFASGWITGTLLP